MAGWILPLQKFSRLCPSCILKTVEIGGKLSLHMIGASFSQDCPDGVNLRIDDILLHLFCGPMFQKVS